MFSLRKILSLTAFVIAVSAYAGIRVGVSRVKMTGPIMGPLLMGYANPSQKSYGLHMDLFARAIVVEDKRTQEPVALVNLDLSQINEALRRAVLDRLKEIYGDRYGDHNVLLSATHTHSALGGLSHYHLYNIASFGFEPENFRLVTERIVEAIQQADSSLEPARAEWVEGSLSGSAQNRSMEPFLKNPEASQFPTGVNEQVQQINFLRADGTPLALWNLFAVHGTSLPNTDRYVSGDNKGWAAWQAEKETHVVAAFANGAAGDMSPDPLGRQDPEEIFQSTRKVAESQKNEAITLLERRGVELNSISSALSWVEMPNVDVEDEYGHHHLCEPAVGYSMIAGAEDGKGSLSGLSEGLTTKNIDLGFFPSLTLTILKKFFGLSVRENAECHGLKPVIFHTWSPKKPGTPRVVPFQVIRFGKLIIGAIPFEATTVSGLRIRKTLLENSASDGMEHAMLVGYANAYVGYLATPEEYDLQHYEGASTHFGRETLPGVLQSFEALLESSQRGGQKVFGVAPARTKAPKWSHDQRQSLDPKPEWLKMGSSISNLRKEYRGGDWMKASFVAANPNNDFLESRNFLNIEMKVGADWHSISTEEDPNTWIRWEKRSRIPKDACSDCFVARVTWRIPEVVEPGTYRLRFTGRSQPRWGQFEKFEGQTHEFQVRQ